jgi:hypothetical protein
METEEPPGARGLAACCGCIFFVLFILIIIELVNKFVYIDSIW